MWTEGEDSTPSRTKKGQERRCDPSLIGEAMDEMVEGLPGSAGRSKEGNKEMKSPWPRVRRLGEPVRSRGWKGL